MFRKHAIRFEILADLTTHVTKLYNNGNKHYFSYNILLEAYRYGVKITFKNKIREEKNVLCLSIISFYKIQFYEDFSFLITKSL